ncbi:MAG: hypothetical protein MUF64_11730 [Polyangiaceae bacterium]|jgi:hypothetical protein|nr:hypothetical protein [Polyangiaceae bacterium]
MDREAIERVLHGAVLQPGEQLYFSALGSAPALSLREHGNRLKSWSSSALQGLTPARALGTVGAMAGAAAMALLPETLADALDATSSRSKSAPPRNGDDFALHLDGSLLALSSARLLLVSVRWTKDPSAPWLGSVQGQRSWTPEQLHTSRLQLAERASTGRVWIFQTGEEETPGEYFFHDHPDLPYNLDQVRAIAGRLSAARQGAPR